MTAPPPLIGPQAAAVPHVPQKGRDLAELIDQALIVVLSTLLLAITWLLAPFQP